MTYLPTLRDLVPEDVKEKICTAEWRFEDTATSRRSFVGSANVCPFSFLTGTPLPGNYQIASFLKAKYDSDTVGEILSFTTAWDHGDINPEDLPEIFGWTPSTEGSSG